MLMIVGTDNLSISSGTGVVVRSSYLLFLLVFAVVVHPLSCFALILLS